MKRIIVSFLSILIAYSANASEALKVTMEGRIDFQAGTVHHKSKYNETTLIEVVPDNGIPILVANTINSSKKGTKYGFVNDTNFDIKVDGRYNPELTYGAFLRMHADTSIATNREAYFGDKALIYVQHNKIGRVEMGNTPGAGGLFEMDTVNLGRGTYGIEGFWSQWVDDRTTRTSNIFNKPQLVFGGQSLAQVLTANGFGGDKETRSIEAIVAPNLLSNYSGHYYSDAPKVNFFTKPLNELTLGVSFIPDMDSAGTIRGMAPKNAGPQDDRKGNPATFKNIVSGGFMYETKFNNSFGIKTGLTGEYGKAKKSYVTNLRAYEAGLMFSYNNFKFGGTYGSWLDSLSLKNKIDGARHGSRYHTLSFSHQIEKVGYTLATMQSRRAGGIEILGYEIMNSALAPALAFTDINAKSFADPKMNKFRNISFDVDYKMMPGFLPYAGVSFYKFNESHGAKDRGYVALLGTRVTF